MRTAQSQIQFNITSNFSAPIRLTVASFRCKLERYERGWETGNGKEPVAFANNNIGSLHNFLTHLTLVLFVLFKFKNLIVNGQHFLHPSSPSSALLRYFPFLRRRPSPPNPCDRVAATAASLRSPRLSLLGQSHSADGEGGDGGQVKIKVSLFVFSSPRPRPQLYSQSSQSHPFLGCIRSSWGSTESERLRFACESVVSRIGASLPFSK